MGLFETTISWLAEHDLRPPRLLCGEWPDKIVPTLTIAFAAYTAFIYMVAVPAILIWRVARRELAFTPVWAAWAIAFFWACGNTHLIGDCIVWFVPIYHAHLFALGLCCFLSLGAVREFMPFEFRDWRNVPKVPVAMARDIFGFGFGNNFVAWLRQRFKR